MMERREMEGEGERGRGEGGRSHIKTEGGVRKRN